MKLIGWRGKTSRSSTPGWPSCCVKPGDGNRELLKWLIRALGQVAEAGLTASSGDRPDIREIHWQSDDRNGRWLVRVDLNRTFSLNLWEESVVSLDVLGDCTLYARELKEELADRASIVGLEVTAVPPQSLRLNMGGGMGFLYSQFVRSIPPDFYIESLTFMDDTVVAEGTHRDLGRPGKLELDVNTAQITEYGKEGDGSFKLRQTYDF
jgi:hypothetical protein